jgi:hypothetical protein
VHSRNIGGHSLYANQTDGTGRSVDVRLVALADAVARLGKIDLMKLDCEGAEFPIIMAMGTETPISQVVWESTPSIYDPKILRKHLEDIGYEVSAVTARTILASRPS